MNLNRIIKSTRSRLLALNPRRIIGSLPRKLLKRTWLFDERYVIEDNTQVTIFTDNPEQFPVYKPISPLHKAIKERRVTVSLVMTARNEAKTAPMLIRSILAQTRLPDEIIVVDTGSQDGTVSIIKELTAKSPVPFKVFVEEGANIARGRNQAIHQAQGEVIAVTDFGCELLPDWLDNLATPFEVDDQIQVCAGRYEPVGDGGQPAQWLLHPHVSSIDPQNYLPPSVSIAFTREAWERVGGYPEWLTLTGEDTYFDLELKRHTTRWAYVPDAICLWIVPKTRVDGWRKAYRWATGNGEIGYNLRLYRLLTWQLSAIAFEVLAILLLTIIAITISPPPIGLFVGFCAITWGLLLIYRMIKTKFSPLDYPQRLVMCVVQLIGYYAGIHNRPEVDRRREKSLKGTFIILSGVPIDDTGGGARCTQIALELLRRQYGVVFINKYPKYESQELGALINHPNLYTSTLRGFALDQFIHQHPDLFKGKPIGALVEFPLGEFIPILNTLQANEAVVIYDLLDAWDTSLGAQWYSLENEKEIIAKSNILAATAPVLADRLDQLSGRPVVMLPNAVNLYLFDHRRKWSRPADLPQADWSMVYIGALWGEWFDWELLIEVAQRFPEANVILIGDYRGQCPKNLANLHFLGLKSQKTLPAYLAHSDVVIIPWKVNSITLATSPLKVYEALAMHKPVVVPDLPILKDLPFVISSRDCEHFIENILIARNLEPEEGLLDSFVRQNSWQTRVDILTQMIPA